MIDPKAELAALVEREAPERMHLLRPSETGVDLMAGEVDALSRMLREWRYRAVAQRILLRALSFERHLPTRVLLDHQAPQYTTNSEFWEVTSPALLWLVANGRIYCDLRTERLFVSDEVWIHESEGVAIAHGYLNESIPGGDAPGWPLHHAVVPVVLDPGSEVFFRDLHCEVVDRSADAVTLRSTLQVDGKHTVIPVAVDDVRKLLRTGELRAARSLGEEAKSRERLQLFLRATPKQIAQARKWWDDLKYHAEHGRVPPGSSREALSRHRGWAERAQLRCDSAFAGLLRPRGRRVNSWGIPDDQRPILDKAIDKYRGKDPTPSAFDPPARSVASAYSRFVEDCCKAGIALEDVLSESTFRRRLATGSPAEAEARRRGHRAGYEVEGPRLFLGPSLPRDGDRIWAVAHVDHALLDLMLVSARVLNDVHRPRFLASALVALWLGGLHRLGGRGAKRLRARDIPALLERDDMLIVDTETTGVGRGAEVIEVVAIDTTGALRFSASSIPVGPISLESWEIHGLSLHALQAQGARPWLEVHQEFAALLRDARCVLAWRADFDARVLGQTAAVHNLALPPIEWADGRPAYINARPKGPHSLADARRREHLGWEWRHHRAEADCRAVLALMRRMSEHSVEDEMLLDTRFLRHFELSQRGRWLTLRAPANR